MARFQPCTSCHRHVRDDADACPFCAAPRARTDGEPAPALAAGRLTRAAIFAGAALVGGTACGGGAAATKTDDSALQDPGTATADAGAAAEAAPDAEVAKPIEPPHHHTPMPYGAPPARDRWV